MTLFKKTKVADQVGSEAKTDDNQEEKSMEKKSVLKKVLVGVGAAAVVVGGLAWRKIRGDKEEDLDDEFYDDVEDEDEEETDEAEEAEDSDEEE